MSGLPPFCVTCGNPIIHTGAGYQHVNPVLNVLTEHEATPEAGAQVAREQTPIHTNTSVTGVDVLATEYEVSILPRDDINRSAWSLTVAYRGEDRYAVLRDGHRCLSHQGTWDYESIPAERREEWIAEHRFSRDEAIRLAVEHAPNMVCNGKTATEILAWITEREASGVAGGGAQ